jgi:hypothetical protein
VELTIHDLEADEGRRHVFGNDDRERDSFKSKLESCVEGIRGGDFQPVEDRSFPRATFRASAATRPPRPTSEGRRGKRLVRNPHEALVPKEVRIERRHSFTSGHPRLFPDEIVREISFPRSVAPESSRQAFRRFETELSRAQ